MLKDHLEALRVPWLTCALKEVLTMWENKAKEGVDCLVRLGYPNGLVAPEIDLHTSFHCSRPLMGEKLVYVVDQT